MVYLARSVDDGKGGWEIPDFKGDSIETAAMALQILELQMRPFVRALIPAQGLFQLCE